MSESFNIDKLFVLYEDVLKLKNAPDIRDNDPLGKLSLPNNGIIKESQNLVKRQKLYQKLTYHFRNKCDRYLHFITVSADLLYFVQRYYNNPSGITRISFAKKFIRLIQKAVGEIGTHVLIEESKRELFVHAHIIVYCQKKQLQILYENLKDAFTNEHKIRKSGKQIAVKISQKDYSTIDRAIMYFLGKHTDGSWKREYYYQTYNFTLKSIPIVQSKLLNKSKFLVNLE